MTFVAIGPHAWGKSEKSIDEAVKNAKSNVPGPPYVKGKYTGTVYEVEQFNYVDDMGRINYHGPKPKEISKFSGVKR